MSIFSISKYLVLLFQDLDGSQLLPSVFRDKGFFLDNFILHAVMLTCPMSLVGTYSMDLNLNEFNWFHSPKPPESHRVAICT